MDFLAYILALFAFALSNFGLMKAYNSIGTRPQPGIIEAVCSVLGGPLSSIGIITLVILGFFYYPMWLPIIALPASIFLAGLAYGMLPIGATYALFGFPIGLILGIVWFALAS